MNVKSACVIVLLILTTAAGGCLVTKKSNVSESGVRVSEATLDQVQPGHTTESWLLATLGEPSSRRKVDAHTQILRYDHRVKETKGGTVLFIYAGKDTTESSNSVVFELHDGVVSRYWIEN